MKDNLIRDMDFIIEIDKLKNIFRQTSLMGKLRRENDAEHSWHLATMALVLHRYGDRKLDLEKTMKILLVHDLVEIYAGDTFCYDKEGYKDKGERELRAANKLFSLASPEVKDELWDLWREFEEGKSRESRFANGLDRLQPILSNYYSEGGTWVEYGIKKDQVLKRMEALSLASEELYDYGMSLVESAVDKSYIKN